jgi:calcium binding protein 39
MNALKQLVKERPKSAPEIVAKAVSALQQIDVTARERALEAALDRCSRYLQYMKYTLFGDDGYDPTKDAVINLALEVVKTDFLLLLVQRLSLLSFEARKDAAQVFGAVVRIKDQADASPGAQYVQKHANILQMLFEG